MIEEGVQSIKEKGLRVVSTLGNRILNADNSKGLLSVKDMHKLGLEATGFDLVVGHQLRDPT